MSFSLNLLSVALFLAGFIYRITLTVILIEDHDDATEKGDGESSDRLTVTAWCVVLQ